MRRDFSMSVLIFMRSLTYAQRGQRALFRLGITSEVRKAPLGSSDRGCTYALRVGERDLHLALSVLREARLEYGKVIQKDRDGNYREVEQ